MEALTYEEYRDTKLQRDFLLTYKVFMTPAQACGELELASANFNLTHALPLIATAVGATGTTLLPGAATAGRG